MLEALTAGLHEVTGIVAVLLGWAGMLVIAFGAVRIGAHALLSLRPASAVASGPAPAPRLATLRIELGRHLALGLELLVGKDVLDTIIDPTWDDLGKLGAIVVLRTLLQIFLAREVRELEEHHGKTVETG